MSGNSPKKVTVVTWNSLKTQNSLSDEFSVLSYDFLPCTLFVRGSPIVENAFEVLRVLK